ncbi:MAG: PAS domain S-box protein [Candidatus Latescibacterota bacterium]
MENSGNNPPLSEIPAELRRKIAELETFRDIVEKANSIMLRWDIQGNIIFLNEYGLQFFGYAPEEITGKNVMGTLVPEEERSGRDLAAMVDDLIAHPDRYVANENENVKKNGERVWVSWTNRAITDENGHMIALLSVGNDITARKKAEDALQDQIYFLQQLIDTIPNPVYYKDIKGVFLGCNRAFQEFVGRSKEQIIGKSIFEIAPHDLAMSVYERDNALLRRTGVRSYEGTYIHPDGSRRDVIFNIATFSGREGKVIGLVGIIFDLTVRKRAEGALMESERKLRSIVGKSLDGIILASEKGLVTEWNSVMESLTGIRKVDAVGKPLWEVMYQLLPEEKRAPEVRDQLVRSISDYFVSGEAPWLNTAMKTSVQDTNGEVKTVRQLSFPVRTGAGYMLGIFIHSIESGVKE